MHGYMHLLILYFRNYATKRIKFTFHWLLYQDSFHSAAAMSSEEARWPEYLVCAFTCKASCKFLFHLTNKKNKDYYFIEFVHEAQERNTF